MLCGEEPRLFEKEEVEAIVSQVGEKEGYSGNSISQQELWRKFIGVSKRARAHDESNALIGYAQQYQPDWYAYLLSDFGITL